MEEFHKFEVDKELFSYQKNGIFYWDVVRYHLANILFSNRIIDSDSFSFLPGIKKYTNVLKFLTLIKSFIYFLWFLTGLKKYDYIFFICSRNIKNGKSIDIISDDLIKNIDSKRILIIETYDIKQTSNYKIIFNTPLTLFKRFANNSRKTMFEISEPIATFSGKDVGIINDLINTQFNKFLIEYKYYRLLISLLKPKTVFFVQNGIMKSLIQACRDYSVHCVELQHGLINKFHYAYSYPKNVDINKLLLPDTFFTFSEFWKSNCFYPTKNNFVIGNNYYASTAKYNVKTNETSLLFISANIYINEVIELLDDYLKLEPDCFVYLKLHPNQINDYPTIHNRYKTFNNIEVILKEFDVSELIAKSNAVVLIQSTVAYEALNAGKGVFIYKRRDYAVLSDLFNEDNVILFNDAKQLYESMKLIKELPVVNKYFKTFALEKFKYFLKQIHE